MAGFIFVWFLFVITALTLAAGVCLVLGFTPEVKPKGEAAGLMSCGHPQSAARYADGDHDSTGYCEDCAKAARANVDQD